MSKTRENNIGRREFLKDSASAAVAVGCLSARLNVDAMMMNHHPVDPPGLHGMLVVGEKTVFLSHLPMFGSSLHNYQVILEATFTKQGSDPQRTYADDRRKNPKARIYTFAPKDFVLPELFPPTPKRMLFQGDIVRGHFEKSIPKPVPIGRDVDVKVTNVVHSRRFDPNTKPLDQLEYLLFGKRPELFLAHLITRPPDFDHVLAVRVVGRQFTDEDLRRGIPIKFPGRANSETQRIKETDKKVSGMIQVAGKKVLVEIEPIIEIFLDDEFLKG